MADAHHRPQQQPETMSPLPSDTPPTPRPGPHPEPNPPVSSSYSSHKPLSTYQAHLPAPPTTRLPKGRRHSLPYFSFPLISQPNTSSISLVPSTAEGRPIPLDDATAADRTTALRELNRSQPSARHRYSKSSGAPSTATSTTTGTYSQPVIVRTYSGRPPSSAASRPASRRIPLSSASITPNVSSWRPGRNGTVLSMARHKANKRSQRADEAKLPPLEAFSFKSIMADIQQDIGADLDRIAEICARSKYSLSNQYEVHVAPHGSGASFLASASTSRNHSALTLQAVPSDDEHSNNRHRKRRSAARRRSVAYGTLETIMSSSRSSEEEKSKKKSAQELADEVRGRASRQRKDESGGSSSTSNSQTKEEEEKKITRKKSASFATAVMDSTRHQGQGDTTSPRGSGTALISEPAKPKTSRNHLEIRTTQGEPPGNYTHEPPGEPSQPALSDSMAAAAISSPDIPRNSAGLLSGISSWMPWRGGNAITEVASSDQKAAQGKSYAEGSLRELLKSRDALGIDIKGKGVER